MLRGCPAGSATPTARIREGTQRRTARRRRGSTSTRHPPTSGGVWLPRASAYLRIPTEQLWSHSSLVLLELAGLSEADGKYRSYDDERDDRQRTGQAVIG